MRSKETNPILSARHSFPVDNAGARAQPGERLDDKRKAPGQVIARPAVQFGGLAIRGIRSGTTVTGAASILMDPPLVRVTHFC
jgi:hypothetical protein